MFYCNVCTHANGLVPEIWRFRNACNNNNNNKRVQCIRDNKSSVSIDTLGFIYFVTFIMSSVPTEELGFHLYHDSLPQMGTYEMNKTCCLVTFKRLSKTLLFRAVYKS